MVRPKTVHNPLLLRVFGVPNLLCCDGGTPTHTLPLRRKDLALLIYLCLGKRRSHSRTSLASLLWGDASEENARHSLTQALARLKAVLGPGGLEWSAVSVEWSGSLLTDAAPLDERDRDRTLKLPTFDFLSDFCIGRGGAEFEIWAEGKRSHYRNVSLRLLGEIGDEAEAEGAWERALSIGQREVEVDQIHEAGHRRIMRSWSAVGERGLALQHYRRLGQWLAVEMDSDPEPETRSLAEELQASYPEEPGRQMQIGHALTFASPPPAFSGITASRPAFVPAVPAHRFRMSALLRPAELVMSLLIAMGLLLASSLTPSRLLDADQISVIPGEGQPFIPAGGGLPLALHRGVLSHFPDWESVDACLNWRSGMIARVDGVPGPVAVRALPSVLEHPWLNGSSLVTTDAHPSITYAVVGCVKSPVDQGTPAMQSRPGPALSVPASVLESLPTGTRLETPIRPAGTVIRVKGRSEMRLVLYGGGALSVPSARVLASHCRSGTAEVDSAEFAFYRVVGRLRAASTGCPTRQP